MVNYMDYLNLENLDDGIDVYICTYIYIYVYMHVCIWMTDGG